MTSITNEQRTRILQNLRSIYNAKIAKWSKLDAKRAEDLKAEAFGAEFILIGILDEMVKGGSNALSDADQRRNACSRGYNRCGWDAKANACVAEGCAPSPTPAPEARKPLTGEQKRAMWMSSTFRGSGGQRDWYLTGIEDAERAHGIQHPADGAEGGNRG